jgi:hypothetical protein
LIERPKRLIGGNYFSPPCVTRIDVAKLLQNSGSIKRFGRFVKRWGHKLFYAGLLIYKKCHACHQSAPAAH